MDSQIYGVPNLLLLTFFTFLAFTATALPAAKPSNSGGAGQINSNSVLVALLDSHYTELSELVEKALLLQTLEEAVSKHNITIFCSRNEALERDLDPEFKRFLLEPGNLKSLQNLLLFHMIPTRIESREWPVGVTKKPVHHTSLCPDANDEKIQLHEKKGERIVGIAKAELEGHLRRSAGGAPEVDPRTHRLKKPAPPVPVGAPPVLPVFDALAPGPSLAPAPAPGPGGPHHHFDGESQVKDFIQTLLHYGGYNEMADILVNLTSLATEMGRLVSEGYVLTVLAPNDEAMAKLTTDQLSEPGAPEQIILPHKVVAEEADGSVKFGQGEGSAYLFDPDIYTDGRISVQGIDGVLFPLEEIKAPKTAPVAKIVSKPRRGTFFSSSIF
ncbi:UNVERIFIED_CONTAM: Fasciclin-like arabinogalactan protein 17 [Sesamum angustifolium]|uniref:Fasciclin-like arabinogalactan protein 17 n=1 Tax=Sesamum angustifolium TaxID=2727405 RepID=A0AAW2MRJ3_9LAMI